jgi:DNA-binding MarR family transcriptional regulator
MRETDPYLWRRANIGRVLFDAARRFEECIHATVQAAGFEDVRFVHLTLTRNMNPDGTRLTDLAARAGVTKQAMAQIVDECEARGIVVRRPDPSDGRARIVTFTPRGRALLEAVHAGVGRAEAEMHAAIGKRETTRIAAALHSYCDAGDGNG